MTTTKNTKNPGRPRSFDVDQAVETAMKLFHARGYDAVGVAELATELGIKPPSFYAAFGSKAGLFGRALQLYAAGEANVFARALEQGGTTAEVIERTFANAARFYPAKDCTAGCLVLDGSRYSSDREARSLGEAARRESVAALRDYIAGERPDRASELAQFVSIALAGMSAAARDGATRDQLQLFADSASRAFARELSA